jgi:hypothetical protein
MKISNAYHSKHVNFGTKFQIPGEERTFESRDIEGIQTDEDTKAYLKYKNGDKVFIGESLTDSLELNPYVESARNAFQKAKDTDTEEDKINALYEKFKTKLLDDYEFIRNIGNKIIKQNNLTSKSITD